MQGYRVDANDFNIIASRIHRTLQVRKELEPFTSQNQEDNYYLLFIERAIEQLKEMHDCDLDGWYNPTVGYDVGNERFIFTWQGKGEQYDDYHKRLEVRIDMNMTIYTIDSIENHIIHSLDFGIINEEVSMTDIWREWATVNQ